MKMWNAEDVHNHRAEQGEPELDEAAASQQINPPATLAEPDDRYGS